MPAEKKKGRVEPTDSHRHYEKGFLLRLSDRQRKYLDSVRVRTGKPITTIIRELIDQQEGRSGTLAS